MSINIEKNWLSQNFFDFRFSQWENLTKCTSFEEQKGTRDIREKFILILLSSAVFRLQNRISDLL